MKRKLLLITAAALLLSGCSMLGPTYKASKDLVGDIKLIESTSGMEKLDDKHKAAFLKAVNAKYGKLELEDASGDFAMDFGGKVSSEDLGGLSMNLTLDTDFDFAYDKNSSLVNLEGPMNVGVLGMEVPMEFEAYFDMDSNTTYTHMTTMGDDNGWEKKVSEKEKDKKEEGAKKIGFSEDDILDVYQDPTSKAFAVLLNPDSETFKKGLEKGQSAMSDIGGADTDVDASDVDLIMTFDEGLSVVGFYTDLSSVIEDEDFDVTTFILSGKLNDINAGNKLKLPKDAKNAKEKDNGEDALLEIGGGNLFGGSESGEATETEESQPATELPAQSEPMTMPETQPAQESEPVEIETLPTASETRAADIYDTSIVSNAIDVSLEVNGCPVSLNDTRLNDILVSTGLTLNAESTGIMVNKGGYEIVNLNMGDDYKYFSMGASNHGDAAVAAESCPVSYISYDIFTMDGSPSKDTTFKINGLSIGDTKEAVYAVFGTPMETFGSIEQYSYGDMNVEFSYDKNNIVSSLRVDEYTY